MRILFIGGTGNISAACTQAAVQRGIHLTLLTRGQRAAQIPAGAQSVTADIEDPSAVTQALAGAHFDSIVDWIAFTPEQLERRIRLFEGRTRQYVFISSASAYQKPAVQYRITESTPLSNPYWQYSRDKIACEDLLNRAHRERAFPMTIVRPSLTYGDTQIPLAVNSWRQSYTAVDRMRSGKKVIVPGDGSSLWVLTHNSDFAKGLLPLLGNPQALGHAFHITSDEALTWDQIYRITGEAAGVKPELIHIPSDFLAACNPEDLGSLTGDKSNSVVFDNSKIKMLAPEFACTTPFSVGVRRTLSWFDADPARRQVDSKANAHWDQVIEIYERALSQARQALAR